MNYFGTYMYLSLLAIISVTNQDNPPSLKLIFEELSELKSGVARGFSDQWNILQNIRHQGIKRHKGLLHIYRAIEKLSHEVETLKGLDRSCKEPPTLNDSFCESPAVVIKDSCFLLKKKRLPFKKAIAYCRSHDGYILDGRNASTLAAVQEYLRTTIGVPKHYMDRQVFIGGKHADGSWTWVDRESFGNTGDKIKDFKLWAPNEPQYKSVGKTSICMALDASKNYMAVSILCSHNRRFVCIL